MGFSAGTGCQAGTGGVDLTGRRGLSASPRQAQPPPAKALTSASALVNFQPVPHRECRVWFEELMGESLHPDSVERPFLVFSMGARRPDRHLDVVTYQLTECASFGESNGCRAEVVHRPGMPDPNSEQAAQNDEVVTPKPGDQN